MSHGTKEKGLNIKGDLSRNKILETHGTKADPPELMVRDITQLPLML